jgi:uncharacterized protein (TIGR03086 family)
MDYEIERTLLSDALQSLSKICEQIRDDQLQGPTPCAAWDLRALLEHITGQHHGVAVALTGSGRDLEDWRPLPIGSDRTALFASIDDLRLAVLDGSFTETSWMPEISPNAPLPTRQVLLASLVDTVAHGWDVGASIGVPVEFSEPVVTAVFEVATRIPDGPERDHPGAAFAHALPVDYQQPSLAAFLALLGRDIAWSAVA